MVNFPIFVAFPFIGTWEILAICKQEKSITIEAKEEVKSIVFINLMGETVKTIIAPTNTVDLSDLATGIYMLQIQFDNAVVNQRLIKE